MDGPARMCFHSVPRIIENSLDEAVLRGGVAHVVEQFRKEQAQHAATGEASSIECKSTVSVSPSPSSGGILDEVIEAAEGVDLDDCHVDESVDVDLTDDHSLYKVIGPQLQRHGVTIEEAAEFVRFNDIALI